MGVNRKRWTALALVAGLGAAGCQAETSFLDPRGEGAAHIANLWWIMLIIGTVVYIQVIALLGLALFRSRQAPSLDSDLPDTSPPSTSARAFIIANGIAIPLALLSVVLVFNFITLNDISPRSKEAGVTIEVIGHRWWWEVRYPHLGVVTANEIYIPTDTQVEIRLTSTDVIHSFWIPALNGKADMIPGQSNRMFLHTDEARVYQGICAELCGLQHAWMRFKVVARPPEEFEQWIAHQQEPAPIPTDPLILRGQQIFLGGACVYCHTISGTSASGVIGPDLTHFASRQTLGAGVLPNTPGNLAGWIIDSQAIKPGNRMPPMYIEGEDLQALLAYMATLE